MKQIVETHHSFEMEKDVFSGEALDKNMQDLDALMIKKSHSDSSQTASPGTG